MRDHQEPAANLHDNLKTILLKKGRVEGVCIMDKFLKVFQGNLGREGRAPQILEEAIKAVGPEA